MDLEAEYDNRARVPEHPQIMAGWERDAAVWRAARAAHSETGLRYGPHPRQRIDVFHPDVPDDHRPLVVLIHGGYWRSLDPSMFSHWAAGANARGHAVALPGYRLCPEVRIADIVDDLRAACLFLHGRFGRPLVACGHSAGGHLTAAMAATDWRAVAVDAPADLIRRGLAISGLYDLTPLLATSVNESIRLRDEAEAAALSPALRAPPPGMMFEAWVGGSETSEYLRQSRMVAEQWAAAGATTHFETIPGANHFTAPMPLSDPTSPLTDALDRLCRAAAKG